MGCGCVSQHHAALVDRGPRDFLPSPTDDQFVKSLAPAELKDKKLLLAYFHRLKEGPHFEVTPQFLDIVRRRGVPPRFRWLAWRNITGWSALERTGLFERCCAMSPDARTVDAIEKDLDRTFPRSEDFTDEKKQQLGTLLRAFACLFPQVGYCQGMNFLGGFLLMASHEAPGSQRPLEGAFYLLVQMMWKYRGNLLFCDGLPWLKQFTYQFRVLLERLFPEVHRHFLQENVTPELYATKWLLTMFTQPLPFATVLRVWDLIICDGPQAVVHVALANIKLLKARLLRQTTEGCLELLSLKGDVIPEGGAVVSAALSLKLTSPCGPGIDNRLSKLEAAWARESPHDAALLERAKADLCGDRLPGIDGAGLSEDAPERPPDGGFGSAPERADSRGGTAAIEAEAAAFADADAEDAAPVADERDGGRGGWGETAPNRDFPGSLAVKLADAGQASSPLPSPHVIAAEARVDIKASMPARRPAATRGYSPTLPSDLVASGHLAGPADAASLCAPVVETLPRLPTGGRRREHAGLRPPPGYGEAEMTPKSDSVSAGLSSGRGSPEARREAPDVGGRPLRALAGAVGLMSPLTEEMKLANADFSVGGAGDGVRGYAQDRPSTAGAERQPARDLQHQISPLSLKATRSREAAAGSAQAPSTARTHSVTRAGTRSPHHGDSERSGSGTPGCERRRSGSPRSQALQARSSSPQALRTSSPAGLLAMVRAQTERDDKPQTPSRTLRQRAPEESRMQSTGTPSHRTASSCSVARSGSAGSGTEDEGHRRRPEAWVDPEKAWAHPRGASADDDGEQGQEQGEGLEEDDMLDDRPEADDGWDAQVPQEHAAGGLRGDASAPTLSASSGHEGTSNAAGVDQLRRV